MRIERLGVATGTLTHRAGEMNGYVDDADLDDLVAELDGPEGSEHPDVSVAHESG